MNVTKASEVTVNPSDINSKSKKIRELNFISVSTDFALDFPSKGTSDYVNVSGMPSLTQFTVCFWMKSSDRKNMGTPFSYAVPDEDNELLVFNYRDFHLYIGGKIRLETSVRYVLTF